MEKAERAGADLFLAKPFDPELLIKSVRALLQGRKGEP
jgi:DNA-binding response OmpR family regulator